MATAPLRHDLLTLPTKRYFLRTLTTHAHCKLSPGVLVQDASPQCVWSGKLPVNDFEELTRPFLLRPSAAAPPSKRSLADIFIKIKLTNKTCLRSTRQLAEITYTTGRPPCTKAVTGTSSSESVSAGGGNVWAKGVAKRLVLHRHRSRVRERRHRGANATQTSPGHK